jgi:hypothetical protein
LLINKHPTISITLHIQYFTTRVQKERAQNSDTVNYQQSRKNSRYGGAFMPQKYELLIDQIYARKEEAITDKQAYRL